MFDALVPIEILLGNGQSYVRRIGETKFFPGYIITFSNGAFGYAAYEQFGHRPTATEWKFYEEVREMKPEDFEQFEYWRNRYVQEDKEEIIYEEIQYPTDSEFFEAVQRDVRPEYKRDLIYVVSVSQKPSTYG